MRLCIGALVLVALTATAAPPQEPVPAGFVRIEPGSFTMGSASGEAGRASDGREGPQRVVHIDHPFALARHELTVGEFRRFVAATGHRTDAETDVRQPGCLSWSEAQAKLEWVSEHDWRAPGFVQADSHPVVCVSWNDARAYVDWLARSTGRPYRLPSEAEWEYAARAGSSTARPWGDAAGEACAHANVADTTPGPQAQAWPEQHACGDGHRHTAPVGHFLPSRWGLHDMIGNVWEWVEDCHASDAYREEPPPGGRARIVVACDARGMRGGAWFSGPDRARSAYRGGYAPALRSQLFGFRVALDLR